MAEVRFYHLTRTGLEAALPVMLEKTLERGQRAVVMAGGEERVEALADHLWTYRDRSFLPHGTRADGYPADQPVWLTVEEERPNGAQVLFMTDGAVAEDLEAFELSVLLFDGRDEEALAAARARWKTWRAAGHRLTYWQQDESGRWSQQAEAGG